MENFQIVIFILTILIVLSAFADRIKLPYPILLVVVGLIIGFVPVLPDLELNPEIVFLVFLPPLLYDAASKTSWHDFKNNIRPISTLAITLVFFTTLTVAVAAHYLIPGFSWPLAFVLGAIISPPDAVAATSITRGLGLNRRVITIIEGESLVNDASALIAYRYAVAAAISGTFVFWKAGVQFLIVSTGGILAGLFIGFIMVFAHKKIKDNTVVENSLSLLTPFMAYLLAEEFHTSGVLSVVTAGLFISWRSREVFSSETRLQTKTIWDTVIFLLNGMVFILIGLQMPAIVQNLKTGTVFEIVGYGLIISLVTIIIRILWVFAGAYHQTIFKRRSSSPSETKSDDTSWKNVLIVAWTGTRGVVSLATALALPLTIGNNELFPKRHTILLLAFIVILVTLVVQGLTLPLLIKLLKIKPQDDLQKHEEKDLQLTMTEDVLRFIDKEFPFKLDEKVLAQIRKPYEANFNLLSKELSEEKPETQQNSEHVTFISQLLSARLELIKYRRELLIKFHKEGTYNDETISKAERELDIEELRLQAMIQKGEDSNIEFRQPE
ncbi:Na+/H+ antiporter [Segetibacter koreensis]|uniref:Na+/H+ antiporter n=1 Tax=Segetibacter koreensis TaxID=398037 RepID=UPI00036647D8|nr:Na+/H+ antiporter [Segetibacter koreensis]